MESSPQLVHSIWQLVQERVQRHRLLRMTLREDFLEQLVRHCTDHAREMAEKESQINIEAKRVEMRDIQIQMQDKAFEEIINRLSVVNVDEETMEKGEKAVSTDLLSACLQVYWTSFQTVHFRMFVRKFVIVNLTTHTRILAHKPSVLVYSLSRKFVTLIICNMDFAKMNMWMVKVNIKIKKCNKRHVKDQMYVIVTAIAYTFLIVLQGVRRHVRISKQLKEDRERLLKEVADKENAQNELKQQVYLLYIRKRFSNCKVGSFDDNYILSDQTALYRTHLYRNFLGLNTNSVIRSQ